MSNSHIACLSLMCGATSIIWPLANRNLCCTSHAGVPPYAAAQPPIYAGGAGADPEEAVPSVGNVATGAGSEGRGAASIIAGDFQRP